MSETDPTWQQSTELCVSCPTCAFTFCAGHITEDNEYECPACALSALRTRLGEQEQALETDEDMLGLIEIFLFEYDLGGIYASEEERVADREETRAQILVRLGKITPERYRERCAEAGWEPESERRIAKLVAARAALSQAERAGQPESFGAAEPLTSQSRGREENS